MQVLDPLERTPDTEAQWQQLCNATLSALASAGPARMLPLLTVAERCCAATGNIARGAFLRRVAGEYEKGLTGDRIALVRAEVCTDHDTRSSVDFTTTTVFLLLIVCPSSYLASQGFVLLLQHTQDFQNGNQRRLFNRQHWTAFPRSRRTRSRGCCRQALWMMRFPHILTANGGRMQSVWLRRCTILTRTNFVKNTWSTCSQPGSLNRLVGSRKAKGTSKYGSSCLIHTLFSRQTHHHQTSSRLLNNGITPHNLQTALLHYVNGGLPALAAQSVIRHRWGARLSTDVLEALLAKLTSSAQHDAAGELLEHLQRYDEALDAFRSCVLLSCQGWCSSGAHVEAMCSLFNRTHTHSMLSDTFFHTLLPTITLCTRSLGLSVAPFLWTSHGS